MTALLACAPTFHRLRQARDRIDASDATDRYLGSWLDLAGGYGGR